MNEYDINGETIWEASKKLKQQARELLSVVKEREAEKLKKRLPLGKSRRQNKRTS